MKFIILSVILSLVIGICLTIILKLYMTACSLKKCMTDIRIRTESILKEYAQNEKEKKKLHSGNSADDFASSIELLQKLSSRS